jgi:hypothetical protein
MEIFRVHGALKRDVIEAQLTPHDASRSDRPVNSTSTRRRRDGKREIRRQRAAVFVEHSH